MDPKTTEDDSLKSLDTEEAALRDEAMKIDPVRPEDADIKDESPEDQAASPDADETAKKTSEAEKKPAADKKADDDKKAAEKASKENADKKLKDDETKLTPYEKERRRLDKSWKELQAEKDATRKEREALDAEKRKQEQERTSAKQRQAKATEKPTHNGYTAQNYEDAAADFRKEGKTEEAAIAEKRAKALRDQEAELAKQAGPADQGEYITLPTGARITAEEKTKMEGEWSAHLKKLMDDNPDLMKDGNPLRTEVQALLKTHPLLHTHSSGIHYAVEVAKLKLAAAQVPTLTTRITELEAENKRLTELTSLSPTGSSAAHRRDKPAPGESGNLEQDESDLREAAMATDARGGR